MRMLTFETLLADYLPVSRPKANAMIARGEFIQPYQIAGKLVFDEDEVITWLKAQPKGLYPEPAGLKALRTGRAEGGV